MARRHKNVYMGKDSTAKIPTRGKVNEDWEILLNTYATAYDAINGIMLTRVPGQFDKTTVKEVRGRFLVLRRLAKKYAPEVLPAVEQLEDLTLRHVKGEISDYQFLRSIRAIVMRYGLSPDLINLVEAKIRFAEMMGMVGNRKKKKKG